MCRRFCCGRCLAEHKPFGKNLRRHFSSFRLTSSSLSVSFDFFLFRRATITPQDIRFLLFPIGLLISVIFLIATLATGLLLPSNHHVLHWRCQTFYVSCLLIGDLLLAITQIFGSNITGVGCISIGEFEISFFSHIFHFIRPSIWNGMRVKCDKKKRKSSAMKLIVSANAYAAPAAVSVAK